MSTKLDMVLEELNIKGHSGTIHRFDRSASVVFPNKYIVTIYSTGTHGNFIIYPSMGNLEPCSISAFTANNIGEIVRFIQMIEQFEE